jgi:hypothetical protein
MLVNRHPRYLEVLFEGTHVRRLLIMKCTVCCPYPWYTRAAYEI